MKEKNTDMLNAAINKYNKLAIETSKVIKELIGLAKEMNDLYKADVGSDLIQEEVAFYKATATHETAGKVLGDDILKVIAHELTKANMSIDWAILLDKACVEKLYFVIETKGTMDLGELRGRESAKKMWRKTL